MKTILNILLFSTFALCELPPPSLQYGFRPSPQFSAQSSLPQTQYGPPKLTFDQSSPLQRPQPQYGPPKFTLIQSSSLQRPQSLYLRPKFTFDQPLRLQRLQPQYGPPKLTSNTLDVQLPTRLTIEQLIRLTDQLQSSQKQEVNNPQTIQLSTPQNSYLPPPREPQRVYGPPSKVQVSQSQLRPPPESSYDVSQPQVIYGTPQLSQQTFSKPLIRPQNQYGPPQSPSSAQSIPQTTYGVPNVEPLQNPSQPSSFGASNSPQYPPLTSYAVPDIRSIETLGEQRNKPQSDQDILRQNLLNDLGKQHLPYKEPSGFIPEEGQNNENQNAPGVNQKYLPSNSGLLTGQQGNLNNNFVQGTLNGGNNLNYIPPSSGSTIGGTGNPSLPQESSQVSTQNPLNVNQQYLPPNSGSSIQRPESVAPLPISSNVPQSTGGGNVPQSAGGGINNVGQNYLPPQTTSRPTIGSTSVRPRTGGATTVTPDGNINFDYDYDLQQPSEDSSNQDDSSDPNVAISNAVAGGRFFYVHQPDGRLQKVVLEKTQEPNSKPEEYVANYYFQNLQAVPGVTYAPLISLGGWK